MRASIGDSSIFMGSNYHKRERGSSCLGEPIQSVSYIGELSPFFLTLS